MSNYVKSVDFAVKDALPTGDPAKKTKGTEVDTEFNNIATAIATKANSNGDNATGTWSIDVNGNAATATKLNNWVVAGGTADAITATYSPAITSLVDGQLCFFRATATNLTTTPTFSPNGLTARTITMKGGAAVYAGAIPAALAEVILRYNLANTRWELLNPAAAPAIEPVRLPVRASKGTNVANLAGGAPNTTDGVSLAVNDRILVLGQSTASQNGIYVVTVVGTGADGTWVRATDADGAGDMFSGMLVAVSEGTTNADSLWMLTTNNPITIGTTALAWERKDAGAAVTKQIQSINATVAANALTLTLNPTTLDFRSATLGSGTVNTRVVASPISVVVSSGSTLGTINAIAARLAIIALDNAGTVELAVVNLAGGNNLDETTLISTAAEGGAGAADSANVIYSTTARTNVPFRVVGFVDITEATAGTWATAPSTIQGIGGQALAALSSLGYGQTWQNVTRTSGTTYYNTTGRPIVAKRDTNNTGGVSGSTTVTINGFYTGYLQIETGGGYSNTGSIIIPAGASYVFTDTTIGSFAAYELR